MAKLIAPWLVQGLIWAVMYGAFLAQLDGAMHVLKFWVWSMALLSLLLVTDRAVADGARQPARPVIEWLGLFQKWVLLVLLVWFGHIASAGALALMMFMIAFHRDATRKARAAAGAGT